MKSNIINIAEILKDCPSGMELDCTMYEDVYFDYVDELNMIHCYIQCDNYKTSIAFNQHGTPNCYIKSKCVIFPKGKTTWEGFVPPNKFDITTLKPFESRVLVRVSENGLWKPAIFGFYSNIDFYVLGGYVWSQCIPYEDNKHLLGTTDDCDDFYKTWE